MLSLFLYPSVSFQRVYNSLSVSGHKEQKHHKLYNWWFDMHERKNQSSGQKHLWNGKRVRTPPWYHLAGDMTNFGNGTVWKSRLIRSWNWPSHLEIEKLLCGLTACSHASHSLTVWWYVNMPCFLMRTRCFRVVSDLLAEVRGLVGCLYKLSEIISMLDMLVSLAHVATMSEYGKSVHGTDVDVRCRVWHWCR